MARISKMIDRRHNFLTGEIDYYYERGRPVVRYWPRHPRVPHSPNQKRSRDALSEARRRLSLFPPALRRAWEQFFFGNKKAWQDFFTSWFIKFYMKSGVFPPTVTDINLFDDGDAFILGLRTDRCIDFPLYLFDENIHHFIRPTYTRGTWDLCYRPGFPSPFHKIPGLGCMDVGKKTIPYRIRLGLQKVYFTEFLSKSEFYSQDCQKFLDGIKSTTFRSLPSNHRFWLRVFFFRRPYSPGVFKCVGEINIGGGWLQLDKNFILQNNVFHDSDYIACVFKDYSSSYMTDDFTGVMKGYKRFQRPRICGKASIFIGYECKFFIKKNYLERYDYTVPVYPDIWTYSARSLWRYIYFRDNQVFSHQWYKGINECVSFYDVNRSLFSRWRIPKNLIKDNVWVSFMSQDGRYFILPPFNLADLIDISNQRNLPLPNKRSPSRVVYLSTRQSKDEYATLESDDFPPIDI